jgi:hypothetical protein
LWEGMGVGVAEERSEREVGGEGQRGVQNKEKNAKTRQRDGRRHASVSTAHDRTHEDARTRTHAHPHTHTTMPLAGRAVAATATTTTACAPTEASRPLRHAAPARAGRLPPLPHGHAARTVLQPRTVARARSRSRPSWPRTGGIGDGDGSDAAADASAAAATVTADETPTSLSSDTPPRRHRKRGGQEGRAGGGAARRPSADEDSEDDGALPADVRAALAALAEASPATLAAALADSLDAPPTEWGADPATRPGAEDVLTQAMLDEDPPGHRSGECFFLGGGMVAREVEGWGFARVGWNASGGGGVRAVPFPFSFPCPGAG